MSKPPCLCTGRADVVCTDTHCDLATGCGQPGNPNECRVCSIRLKKCDPSAANPVPNAPGDVAPSPLPRRTPCRYLGDLTGGMVECGSCPHGKTKLRLYACALHVVCTLGAATGEYMGCLTCPDYEARIILEKT